MNKFFAAANSARGFVGWFDDIFAPETMDRTYIIKGGSGTGKSTLMKKVAAKWCESGGECEYFYCSSDPESLDGILLTKGTRRIAMLDGTAPHMRDPRYPGAAEELVNLGDFWDTEKLVAKRSDIIKLTKRKSKLFADAYRDLAVAGEITKLRLGEIGGCILKEKLDAAATRLLSKRMKASHVKGSAAPVRRIRVLSAISTLGEVSFDGVAEGWERCLVVDAAGSTPFLLDAMRQAADTLGLDYDFAPMPLLPELTEAIFFPKLRLAIVSSSECADGAKLLNMSRFLDRDRLAMLDRPRARNLRRLEKEMLTAALSKLSDVRRAHMALEAIYRDAMDFTKLDAALESVIAKIMG